MMFQLVSYSPHPSFEAVYCYICGGRRVGVTLYRMICLVILLYDRKDPIVFIHTVFTKFEVYFISFRKLIDETKSHTSFYKYPIEIKKIITDRILLILLIHFYILFLDIEKHNMKVLSIWYFFYL